MSMIPNKLRDQGHLSGKRPEPSTKRCLYDAKPSVLVLFVSGPHDTLENYWEFQGAYIHVG